MESEYHIHIGKTGESDVLVSFIDEYGDNTELIWIWDPVERYVFREDLSTIAIGDSDQDAEQDMHLEADADLVTNLEDYVGLWEYQGENRWLRIHDDFTWEFVNDQDDVIASTGNRLPPLVRSIRTPLTVRSSCRVSPLPSK